MDAVMERAQTRCARCARFGVVADSRLCGPCASANPDFAAVESPASGPVEDSAPSTANSAAGEEAEIAAYVRRMAALDSGETPPTAPTAAPTMNRAPTDSSDEASFVRRMVALDDEHLRAQQAEVAARVSP